ncbi:MAG TPA: hypothetical protein VIM93_00205 [Kangiella sp.]
MYRFNEEFVCNPAALKAVSYIKDKGIAFHGDNKKLIGFVTVQDDFEPKEALKAVFDAVAKTQGKSNFLSLPDGSFFEKAIIGSLSIVKTAVVINGLDGHVLYWLDLDSPEQAKDAYRDLTKSLC